MEAQKYAGSIQLPDTDVVFRNIKNAKRFAIDIGKITRRRISHGYGMTVSILDLCRMVLRLGNWLE